jgi:glucose/mannose-6-phosphate isomerase
VYILDDATKIREIDQSNMLEKIDLMPEYLGEATDNFKAPLPLASKSDFDSIVLVGMGTSAIAAEIALNWLADHLDKATILVRDRRLPNFSNKRTMILAVSYSGDTQETLEALLDAIQKGCQVVTVSSGGNMRKVSENSKIPHINVKAGLEPRTAFPFLLVASSLALSSLSNKTDANGEIREAVDCLKRLRDQIGWRVPQKNNSAKQLALNIVATIPVVYAFHRNSGLARRMKNQLNENSKMPAVMSILPESCHNELEVWGRAIQYESKFSHVFLRTDETQEEDIRVQETKRSLAEMKVADVYEIAGVGRTRASQLLSVTYFIDYVSFYLSILREIDPTPWERIQELKRRVFVRTHFKEMLDTLTTGVS